MGGLKSFSKNIFILQISLAVSIVFSFGFYTSGHYLSTEDFGILNAMFTIINFLTVIQTIVKNIVIKDLLDDNPRHFDFRSMLMKITLLEIVLWLGFSAFSMLFLKDYINLSSYLPLLVTSFFIFTSVSKSVLIGMTESRTEFLPAAISATVESIGKFALGLLTAIITQDVSMVLLAVFLSYIFSFFVLFISSKKTMDLMFQSGLKGGISVLDKKAIILDGLMLLSLTSIYSIDIIILKNNLSKTDVGVYSAIAVLGKLLYFTNLNIARVYYPKGINKKLSQLALVNLIYLVLSIGAAIVFLAAGKLVISKVIGIEESINNYWLVGVVIFVSLYSVFYTVANYLLINKSRLVVYVVGMIALLQIALLNFLSLTLDKVFTIQILLMIAGTVLISSVAFFERKR